MPKENTKKNSKGSVKKTTKASTTKKANTKQPAKKVEKVVKVEKKETVKNEVVKAKPVVKMEKKKGNKFTSKVKEIWNKIITNTPFAISLCIILLLVGVLLVTISHKRIPKTSDNKQVLATVKGKKFTADDLYESMKANYGTDALISLIDSYIADKEVKVTDDDKDYVQQVVDYYIEYADYYGVDLVTFLNNYVGISGIENEDQFFDYILKDYKKTLAVMKFIGDEASEDELKAYYKENFTDKLTVKHILIEIDTEAEDQEKAEKEAYDKTVNLIEKLNNTDSKKLDSKFEELAKENSDDTATYSNGGLIEDFTKNDVVESFWNAAYELKDGEYTKEPVKSRYGYHIILKVSSTPAEKYKDIKDKVKKAYAEELLNNDSTLSTTKWAELRKQYKLSIKDDVVKEAYNKNIKNASKSTNEKENNKEPEA